MSETWVKVDAVLGDRARTFLLPLRRLSDPDWGVRDALAKLREHATDPAAVDEVERVVVAEVARARPELADGAMTVWALSCDLYRNVFLVTVTHPSFPRNRPGEVVTERLERCPGCSRPLPDSRLNPSEDYSYLRLEGVGQTRRTVEYCSQSCAEAHPEQQPTEAAGQPPHRGGISPAPGNRDDVFDSPFLTSRRTFIHRDMLVEELRLDFPPSTHPGGLGGEGGKWGLTRLVWVREAMEIMTLDPPLPGVTEPRTANPLCWADVVWTEVPGVPMVRGASDPDVMRARQSCRKAFEAYWSPSELGQLLDTQSAVLEQKVGDILVDAVDKIVGAAERAERDAKGGTVGADKKPVARSNPITGSPFYPEKE